LEFENDALLKPTLRNNSVLIHGFVAGTPEDSESLHRLFGELVQLARDDDFSCKSNLRVEGDSTSHTQSGARVA